MIGASSGKETIPSFVIGFAVPGMQVICSFSKSLHVTRIYEISSAVHDVNPQRQPVVCTPGLFRPNGGGRIKDWAGLTNGAARHCVRLPLWAHHEVLETEK